MKKDWKYFGVHRPYLCLFMGSLFIIAYLLCINLIEVDDIVPVENTAEAEEEGELPRYEIRGKILLREKIYGE